jgi:trans-aconitate 2-methyltransferase
MSQDSWDPSIYGRFAAERAQPLHDLATLCEPAPGLRVLDLGCGSGEHTAWLHGRLGAAHTLGIDSSANMLARAGAHVVPGLRFELGDLLSPPPGPWGLVFSNAALHWVTDHPSVLAGIARVIAPGGQIAVQLPDNFGHVSHRVAHELALEPPFAEHARGLPSFEVLAPERYAELLDSLGFAPQHVRLQVYGHELAHATQDLAAWAEGSLLTPHRKALPDALYAQFLARYCERLQAAVGDGRYYLTYRRILFWGRKR